jgi:hypothetical protein
MLFRKERARKLQADGIRRARFSERNEPRGGVRVGSASAGLSLSKSADANSPGTTPEPEGTEKYHFGTTKYQLGTTQEPLRNRKVPLFQTHADIEIP